MSKSYAKKIQYLAKHFGILPVFLPIMSLEQKMRYFSIVNLIRAENIDIEKKREIAKLIFDVDIDKIGIDVYEFLNDEEAEEAFEELKIHTFFNEQTGVLN